MVNDADTTATNETTNTRRVLAELKRDILDRQLPAGRALTEVDLASRYDASRTPVREALSRLEQAGLVVRGGRSYRVRSYSLEEIEHIYELREALEKMAVRLLIQRGPDAALADLNSQLANYPSIVSNADIGRYNQMGRRFHLTIADHSGNPLLRAEVSKVHDQIRLFRGFEARDSHAMEKGLHEHVRIVRAIEARDVTVAEAEIRFHLQTALWLHRTLRAGGSVDASGAFAWPPPVASRSTGRETLEPGRS